MAKNVRTKLAVLPFVPAYDLASLEDRAMKEPERRAMSLSDNLECFVSVAAITVYGEITIERSNLSKSEPFHHREACAIDD